MKNQIVCIYLSNLDRAYRIRLKSFIILCSVSLLLISTSIQWSPLSETGSRIYAQADESDSGTNEVTNEDEGSDSIDFSNMNDETVEEQDSENFVNEDIL